MTLDPRFEQLQKWASEKTGEAISLTPLLGDASFRRYFFINQAPHLLAVDAPPASENNQGFLALARHFKKLGLNAPEVKYQDLNQGFFIITFVEGEQFLSALNGNNCITLYHQAINQLVWIQSNEIPSFYYPPEFNAIKLTNELENFQDWFVHELLHYELSGEQHYNILKCYEKLIQSALHQPYVLIHRDFHSRNLLWDPEQTPSVGILDFQDALMGPITYDLVSLLRDCYITWPEAVVQECLQYYYFQAKQHGLLKGVNYEQFQRWFDWMGIQRHLKATFIFARKYLRDYNDTYLQYIQPTLEYVNHVTRQYEELAPLHEFINMNLLPLWTQLQTL